MNSRAVVFYSDFGQPTVLLAVALHSLERVFKGPIYVVLGQEAPDWFETILKRYSRIGTHRTKTTYPGATGRIHAYNVRAMVHKEIPFSTRVMFDADHVFINPPDEQELFGYVERHGLGSYGFPITSLRGSGQSKAEAVANEIRSLGLPCNTKLLQPSYGNCVGSVAGSEDLIDFWLRHMDLFTKSKNRWLASKFCDQHSLSYTMFVHNIPVGSWKCSYSGQQKSQKDINPPPPAFAIHFGHGRYAHAAADHVYAKELAMVLQEDFMGMMTEIKRYNLAHPALQEFCKARQNAQIFSQAFAKLSQ